MGYRTHVTGEIGLKNGGEEVVVAGWAGSVRDHGGLIFVDVRDHTGLAQCVFDPGAHAEPAARAKKISSEDVVRITGKVRSRPVGTENAAIASGAVEIEATALEVINECAPLPFALEEKLDTSEETRLKYRYLDLRRPGGAKGLKMRHDINQAIRNLLGSRGFLEVETPILWKSTPEGARDYIVPSRVHPGKFFALPQSPQLLKQTLMVSGVNRYYQIARCFRDEDLRADRQPEFTQIDVEMSFPTEDEVLALAEDMVEEVFRAAGQKMPRPVQRLTYAEAMARYGSDKPDLRCEMVIGDATEALAQCGAELIKKAVEGGARVKVIALPAGVQDLSRSQLDELDVWARTAGAAGLSWWKVGGTQASPLMKRLSDAEKNGIAVAAGASAGQWVFLGFDPSPKVEEFMGELRMKMARQFNLLKSGWSVVWVREFPALHYSVEEKRWDAAHNPFSAVYEEDVPLLDTDPGRVRAHQYDLAINGTEVLGGSLRIHDSARQHKMLKLMGMSDEIIEDQFGFLLRALAHGAPPHGGFAGGIDRLVMLLGGFQSIRDTIAFPKTQRAICPLSNAPSSVTAAQLRELRLKVVEEKQGPQ